MDNLTQQELDIIYGLVSREWHKAKSIDDALEFDGQWTERLLSLLNKLAK